jgi:hypothetical protein
MIPNHHAGGIPMNQAVHFRRLQRWAQLVLEAENSGDKITWCRQNHISYRQYMYWQRLVRDYLLEHGENSLSDPAETSLPVMESHPQQLVDVTAKIRTEEANAVPSNAEDQSVKPELMIQYRDCRIYVSSAVSSQTLSTVMKALRDA